MSLLATAPTTETDEPVDSWTKPVPPDVVRRLSTLRPAVSLAHACLEWCLILVPIVASWRLFTWNVYAGVAAYVLTVVWIGARQHALAVLMHEAAHYRLMPNRAANDFFGELLAGWPLLMSMRAYRQLHFAHHRSPNTQHDPDWLLRQNEEWSFPKDRRGLAKVLLMDLFGLGLVDQLRFFGRYAYRRGKPLELLDYLSMVFYGGLFAMFTYFGLWQLFLLYWIVPMFTWLKVALRLRTIGEHYGLEYDHMFRQTRTTYPTLLERLLIAPKNIGYHLDHHLYPSVPFYNLPALHQELLASREFQAQAHVTRSYLGVLRECLHCNRIPPEMWSQPSLRDGRKPTHDAA